MKRFVFALVTLGACNDTQIVVGGLHEVTSMRAIANRDLDILFVVDNSPSMAAHQQALATNFPKMMDVLGELEGGLPNLHIGVISSDMGTSGGPPIGAGGSGGCADYGSNGVLQLGSAQLSSGNFISDIDAGGGTREKNYTGELRDVFPQVALLGEQGCGFEQTLASVRAALVSPDNAGFIRPTANLAVVILSDEDDCSANASLFGPESPELGPISSYRCFAKGVICDGDDPNTPGVQTNCVPRSSTYMDDVQPFVDALMAAKPDARQIMTAAIIGPTDPVTIEQRMPPGGGTPQLALGHSCATGGGNIAVADPGIRLASFVDAFAPRSTVASICGDDFATPLVDIGATAKRLVGDPCIDTVGLADVSPDAPGIQPACEVIDIRDALPDAGMSLPGCGASGGDCYEIIEDAIVCPRTEGHLRIHVKRATQVAADTWTHVRCQATN